VTETNEPTSPAAKKRSGGLSTMLVADLKAMAGGLGISGAGSMKKPQLVEAIKAAQSGGQSGGQSGRQKTTPPAEPAPVADERPQRQAEAPSSDQSSSQSGGSKKDRKKDKAQRQAQPEQAEKPAESRSEEPREDRRQQDQNRQQDQPRNQGQNQQGQQPPQGQADAVGLMAMGVVGVATKARRQALHARARLVEADLVGGHAQTFKTSAPQCPISAPCSTRPRPS